MDENIEKLLIKKKKGFDFNGLSNEKFERFTYCEVFGIIE